LNTNTFSLPQLLSLSYTPVDELLEDSMSHRALIAVLTLAIALVAYTLHVLTSLRGTSIGGQHEEAITSVLTRQQTAWNQGDVNAFMAGYWNSPELTFAGSDGISRGWDKVLARYQRAYPDKAAMGQLEFSALEIRSLSDKSALALGQWHLTRTSGNIGGVFTLVFEHFSDGWKIIHDHTSQVVAKTP
jgi:ketosteroid isomerase-like protein